MSARQTYRVPPSLGGARLDRVLEELVAGASKAQLQKLVRRGRVTVGGRRVVRSNVRVDGKAEIVIEAEPAGRSAGVEAAPEIVVLHEDEHLLVVAKPTGLLTHAADRSDAASLAALLDARFGPLPTPFGVERPGIVHRLDRETSGVLAVGRTEDAMHALKHAFRQRDVAKSYLALVHGTPSGPFVANEPLGPVPGKADRQMAAPPRDGRSARTRFEVSERFTDHALVTCHPETGRRHQIRVHLAERGFPVLADPLYGTRRRRSLPPGVPRPGRLALHAHALDLPHPHTGKRLRVAAPLPADLQATLDGLRPRSGPTAP